MGEKGPDIKLTSVGRLWFPYIVECKNNEKKWKSVYDAYNQQKSNEYERLLVIKRDFERPLVVIDAEYFLNLISVKPEGYKDGQD